MYSQRRTMTLDWVLPTLTMRDKKGDTIIESSYSNAALFRSIIKYLEKLRKDGEIDEDTFNKLLHHCVAYFVEKNISDIFENILKNKPYLNCFLESL